MRFKNLLILPMFVASLQAASVSDLTFTLINGDTEYSVSARSESASGPLVIPSTYGGKPVTEIGINAFSRCTRLTSITIPDSVTSIGDYAFRWCNFLTSITIPNSVISIGRQAFRGLPNLTSITIPNSVTSIGSDAFQDCNYLSSIIISNSLTSIEDYLFNSCSRLASVTIPDSVTSIGDYAFTGCSSLTSITIPDSVTSIGDYLFNSCSSLASVTIPDSVTSIGDYAFIGCSSLESITIPNSVNSIGRSTFQNCSGLTSFAIPDGVNSIGDYAFTGCSSLTSITISDSVTSIGQYAFLSCSSLESITIPNSVISIGKTAFEGCSSLDSITLPYNFAYSLPPNAVPIYTFDSIVDELKNDPDFIGAVAQAMLAAENNSGFATKEELPLVEQVGIDQVLSNPTNYDLATSAEVASSRTAGQQDVISSPSDYDLMGVEGVFDVRVSQPGISMSGDKASMNFTIQSSNDLEEWNNEETIQREYTMPSDKNFMRVSVGPQLEPESLTTITSDTYGDKLVYDDSNNLYVNDKNTPLKRNGINLRTDTYSGWNFYAIEPVGNRYLCILKNGNRNVIMFFELNGNYLYNTNVIYDLSAYESDFGQSLN